MRQGWTGRGAGLLVAALVVSMLPAAPALAVDVRSSSASRVLGDVSHERIEVRLPSGGVARGDLLRFREDDPHIRLRPRLARGTVSGVQQMVPLSEERRRHGAIAGINGGYFLPRPPGVPNGLYVTDGRMVAGQAVTGYGTGARPTGRGMVGIQPDGGMVMDELLVGLQLDQPDLPGSTPALFDELNRQVWPDSVTRTGGDPWRPDGEMLLYDEYFGASINVPGGATVVVVRGLDVGTSGRTEGDVVAVYNPPVDTGYSVSPDRYAIVAYGQRAQTLAGVAVGQRIGVTSTITPKRTAAQAWVELTGGVAGGQLLVQAGTRRPSDEWTSYAAFSQSHATGRNPRTAIGRTADGGGLLLTIDGRRPGWSAGLTVGELADTMIELGAVDAVNLDGGGSTTMTVDAEIRNRPSETGRSVADGLFLHAALPPPSRPLVGACPEGGVPSAGFEDTPGTTHAASIDCLAWWAVTSGVTPTRYAPDQGVTREQMASFVARWMDGVAERGDGQQLPDAGPATFEDVTEANVHGEAIARLTGAGIIRGTSATTYGPRGVMTRSQTASLVRGAVEYVIGSPLDAGRDTFLDDNTSVHEANIDALAALGVITGTGDFAFQPDGRVTRGAMSALIMRSSDLVVELGRTTPPT